MFKPLIAQASRRFAAIVVCGLVSAAAHAQAPAPGTASQFVKIMGDEAISTLRAGSMPPEARASNLRAVLARDFDMEFIGRFVLGQHWQAATPDQQREYLQAFREYVLQLYSVRLGSYAGETLTVTSERPAGAKDTVVDTRLERPGGPPVTVQWRLRANAADWRIIDVVVEGVSLIVTQRDEFASVVQRQKVSGLIELLRARTTMQRAEASPERSRTR